MASTEAVPKNLTVPIKLDAFIFNHSACDGVDVKKAKIAPITQPNYTFLRLEDYMVQNDILDPTDLHNSAPSSINPRFTDLGRRAVRQERVGAYLHWIVPRPFRSGTASTSSAEKCHPNVLRSMGIDSASVPLNWDGHNTGNPTADTTVPVFLPIPNRWLVIRTLDPDDPTTQPQGTNIERVKAWVIESDKTRSIDALGLDIDLQVDVAPFITSLGSFLSGDKRPDLIKVDEQAEVFIGSCYDATKWSETAAEDDKSRVQLTAGSSSNQLFMDYQYHCGNVFSMVDNFAYTASDGSVKHLQSANASYYVIGWQRSPKQDIMFLKDAKIKTIEETLTRAMRLTALSMDLRSKTIPDKQLLQDWTSSPDSARTLCHGALYNVRWLDGWDPKSETNKPPAVPADDLAEKMAEGENIAVGTTPIDSILAHVIRHDPDSGLESFIHKLDQFLKAEDESVRGQEVAADEIQNINYHHFEGGSQYALSERDLSDPSKRPAEAQERQLQSLNARRLMFDSLRRREQQLQWDIFSVWWKYISDIDNLKGKHNDEYSSQVRDIYDTVIKIRDFAAKLIKSIEDDIEEGDCISPKEAVLGSFHQQNDPTLLLAGLQPGWPKDFRQALYVRLDNQLISSSNNADDEEIKCIYQIKCLPLDVQSTGIGLVKEFLELGPKDDSNKRRDKQVPPLYHDLPYPNLPVSPGNPWRDQWSSTQPWFPLYIEWKAQYYHIPFDKWGFIESTMRPTGTTKRLSYGLTEDVTSGLQDDLRVLSGRTLILPQPSFSLRIRLDRIFDTIPEKKLNEKLEKGKREELYKGLDELGFLSSPLSGLHDHLATRATGTHIKPLVRIPGYAPVALQDAVDAADKIGITKDLLTAIDVQSGLTPYGAQVGLNNNQISAFKPVTHGQMRFLSINIIDKFGQAVHAVNPLEYDFPSPPIYPAKGDYYQTSATKEDIPNVVDPGRSTTEHCEFIQLPPTINQPARLNAEFMERKDNTWKVMNAWDSPIWGWVVINFVDNGLQFFQHDGTFYREVRVSQGSQSKNLTWLPFEPPKTAGTAGITQLDYLIQRMTIGEGAKQCLLEFQDMIAMSVRYTQEAPDAYGQFLNALVGKPLALVNMGWSLELSTKSWKNQSTVNDNDKLSLPYGLLPGDGQKQYSFPVKFGDMDRSYDGLIGYFLGREEKETRDGPEDNLNLNKCYTYYGTNLISKTLPKSGPKPKGHSDNFHTSIERAKEGDKHLLVHISSKYPHFNPTWNDPDPMRFGAPADNPAEIAAGYARERDSTMQIFGALVDPFLPINAYSSILPIKSLRLPTWTWESALKKMTTFMHAGPLIVTENMPDYDAERTLGRKYNLKDLKPEDLKGAVSLPTLQVADWNWLQPYDRPIDKNQVFEGLNSDTDSEDKSFDGETINNDQPGQAYVPFSIQQMDDRPMFQKTPYTAIEGYMQLKMPIESKAPQKGNGNP